LDEKMENITQIVQKVKQAPWRVQRQWIGLLLLGLVLMTMVAGIYLNVTAQAAISGRQIQILTADIEKYNRVNADLEIELAGLTSSEAMQDRADELGFHPATTDEIAYVAVPGYVDSLPVNLSSQVASRQPSLLKSEYSETLFDWFTRKMTAGAQP
jgi:cell division protein FtsL